MQNTKFIIYYISIFCIVLFTLEYIIPFVVLIVILNIVHDCKS